MRVTSYCRFVFAAVLLTAHVGCMVYTEEPLSSVGKTISPEGVEGRWGNPEAAPKDLQTLAITKTGKETYLLENLSDETGERVTGVFIEIDGRQYFEPKAISDKGREINFHEATQRHVLAYRIHLDKDDFYIAAPDRDALVKLIEQNKSLAGHKSTYDLILTTPAKQLAEVLEENYKTIYKQPLRFVRVQNPAQE